MLAAIGAKLIGPHSSLQVDKDVVTVGTLFEIGNSLNKGVPLHSLTVVVFQVYAQYYTQYGCSPDFLLDLLVLCRPTTTTFN